MDLRETPAGGRFQRHPWEVTRSAFFLELLSEHGAARDAGRALDVGAGDAWFARQLSERLPAGAEVVCWDPGYEATDASRAPVPRLRFTAERPEGPFDLALLMDVLEHVPDDAAFLDGIVRELVAPTGWVLVSVPAWQQLMSAHDVALQHHRRYAPARAQALLEGAGLRIVRSGGLFHSLLLPRGLTVAREALLGRPDGQGPPPALVWTGPRWLARGVEGLLQLDTRVSRQAARWGLEVPGLSWWALCRR